MVGEKTGRAHRVAVLVRPGVMPFELGLVHQLFASARREGRSLYAVRTCGVDGPGELGTDADFAVRVPHGPEALEAADTVLVPASHGPGEPEDGTGAFGEPPPELAPGLAAALRRIRPGTRIASVCTGAFVLAAAGLLDGRRATTHWRSAEHFRRAFPRVRFVGDVLYTDEGDVLTSAGEAAGIDLCLHLIRRDFGAAVAAEAARATVVAPHRDGSQAQSVPRPVAGGAGSGTAEARAWVLGRLERPTTVAELAGRAGLSVRGFSRRFREETGETPMRWLARQRVALACRLLEETDLPVDAVAARSGHGTGASLRAHFTAAMGVPPAKYRRAYRR